MGIRNKVTGEMYTITSYNPTTGNITGINNTTGNSDLGNVSNIYIGGGNPGEILSTDGAGNLSWIPDGGGANTGDVTFADNVVIGTGDEFGGGGLYLAPGVNSPANLQYLRVRGGDYPTHVHLDTGNNQFFDQYFGADARFVKLEANGNIVVNADDYAGNAATWTFDASGKVTVPGAIVSAFGNVQLQPDPANADSYLDVFLTSGPDLHLVASQSANLILGKDNGANVMTSWDGNAYVQSWNQNTGTQGGVWTFGGDGSTTFPNGAKLNPTVSTQFATDNGVVTSIDMRDTSGAGFYTNGSGYTLRSNGTKNWIFDTDGNLRTPGNVDIYGSINFPQQVSNINWSTYNIELSQYGRINTNVDFFANANVIGAQYLKGDGSNISNIAGANVTGEVALANTVSNPAQPNITSVGTLVSLTTGSLNTTGLFTANGNAQFNQDVYFAGNVTLPGNINQISGNSASFFGDPATGFGALYVGLPTGYTLLDNEVAQFSDNFNGYTQVTHRNINGGDQATGDFVITADNGTDLVNHIDLGIAGSGYDGALANNSLGTALYPNDGYLYTRGNVTGGNLILGSNQTNGVVRIIANGASNIGDTVATFAANGLTVSSNVAASYFLGNGSQLTSIANGSNTQVQFNNDGNLAASANLTFADSVAGGVVEVGTELTLLGNGTIGTSGSDLLLQPAGNLVAEVAGNDWTFDSTGNLTIPGSSGGLIKTVANASIGIVAMDNGTDNPAQLMSWNVGAGAPTSIISAYSTNATIQTNAAASINTWQFLANAVTVFPGDLIGSGASPAPSINGFNSASFAGNVTANYFIGNGSQLTGMYGNTNVAAYLPGYTGQLNRVTIISASGNIDTSANINVTGNIYATYVLGNGSQLTDLPAPVVTQDITSVGDMSIMTYDGNIKYVNNATIEPATGDIASAGNIVATGNVQGAYVLGNGSQLTGLGNIVTVDLNGNVSQVLAGDGTWIASTPSYGDANVSTYLASGTDTAGYSTLGNIQIGTTGNTMGASDYSSTSTQVTLSWFDLQFPIPFNIGETVLISDIVAPGPVELNGYWTLTGAGSRSITFDTTLNPGDGSFDFPGPTITANIVSSISVTGNISGANLTSTRVIPRTDSVTTLSSITPSAGSSDQFNITALATSATIQAPSGTATDGQKLTIRILDNGTGQTLTWDAIYQVIGTTLPTTTVANKYVYVGCIYNAQDTTWDVVSVAQQA